MCDCAIDDNCICDNEPFEEGDECHGCGSEEVKWNSHHRLYICDNCGWEH